MILFARATALLLAAAPAPVLAQEAPADPMATAQAGSGQAGSGEASVAAQVAAARQGTTEPQATPACKPKKKKGFGLGGILKAASKTGLTNMVGGGLLGGYGGAIAGTAINTGVNVAEGGAKPNPPGEGC